MLLRRNGEACEHPVPGFPGLLTESEQKAYTEVITSMAWLLKEFNDAAVTLAEIEKTIPTLAKQASEITPENGLAIRNADSEWQIHRTLHKSDRNEVLLCSRRTEQGTQFGIVEQFTHNSIYANAHGDTDVRMTSNRASLLAILIVATLPKSPSSGYEENTFETSSPSETPPWRKDISEVFSSDDYDYLRKLARYQKDPQHWPCPLPPDLPRKTEYESD